jgi:hypothetical protein
VITRATKQLVLLPGARSRTHPRVFLNTGYRRTVRDIKEWDGRIVGIVRHGGGEWLVQLLGKTGVWEALTGVSTTVLRTEPTKAVRVLHETSADRLTALQAALPGEMSDDVAKETAAARNRILSTPEGKAR